MFLNSIFLRRAIANAISITPLLACVAHAQNAANPKELVPPVTYQSVFASIPMGVEKKSDNWPKANQETGQFLRGHIDLLKWEQEQMKKAATPVDKLQPPKRKH